MKCRIVATLLFCIVLYGTSKFVSAQSLNDAEVDRLFNAAVHPDLPNAPAQIELVNKQRQESLANLFSGLFDGNGPEVELLDVFEDGILTRHELIVKNVKVVLPGKHADKVIVLGAHLDQVARRPGEASSPHGIIDDWSGVAMLVKLYEHLKAHAETNGQFHHTFVFVGFAYEESGLWGSESFVQQLIEKDQLSHVKAMVNFECLGVSDLFTWDNGSTEWLEELASNVANQLDDVTLQRRMLTGVGADSVPFILADRPAITIDSLSSSDFGKIHTQDDFRGNINNSKYRSAYGFAKRYLKELDATLAAAPDLADQHDTLPHSFAAFAAEQSLKRISWEPNGGSIVPTSFADFNNRTGTYELLFISAIEKANTNWIAAAKSGDAKALSLLYAEDAVILTPDAGPKSGRNTIREYYSALFQKAGGSIDTKFTRKSLALSDRLAYETGTYTGSKPISSYVIWKPIEVNGQLQAQLQFDAWTSVTDTTTNFSDATPSSFARLEFEPGTNSRAVQVEEGAVFAVREADKWIIVGVRNNGKAKKTMVQDITDLTFGTDIFPR